MTEAVDAKNDEKKQESATLAKIEPSKVEKGLIESVSPDIEATDKIEIEKSLISATRLLLRHYGIRKVEPPSETQLALPYHCRPQRGGKCLI